MTAGDGQGPDLTDIGKEVDATAAPTDQARREEASLAIEHTRENNHHLRLAEERKLGAVGKFFGSRDNAIVYIVAILLIICAISVAVLSFVDASLRPGAFEFFRVIAIALVGFFAGRSIPSKDD